jgi:hypothetical protein
LLSQVGVDEALLFHELATNAAKYGPYRFRSARYLSVGRVPTLGYASNGVKARVRRSPFQIIADSGHDYFYERWSNSVEK